MITTRMVAIAIIFGICSSAYSQTIKFTPTQYSIDMVFQNDTNKDIKIYPTSYTGCGQWPFGKVIHLRKHTIRPYTGNLGNCHFSNYEFQINFDVQSHGETAQFSFQCGTEIDGCATNKSGFPMSNKKQIFLHTSGPLPWAFIFANQ